MNILQVSKADILGGAERIAWEFNHAYRQRGHNALLAVGEKHSDDPGVLEIPTRGILRPALRALAGHVGAASDAEHPMRSRLATYLANPGAFRRAILGQDSFHYPGSAAIPTLAPAAPDIIHGHNLHGSYFDLRLLAKFAGIAPVVLTLHDAWLITGGCTHPLDCNRWKSGCGHCPYRHLYFRASLVDSTAYNWRRKKRILQRARMHIITPCQWLLDQLTGSIMEPAIITQRVIPNGVDLTTFYPPTADVRAAARRSLNITPETRVILHASRNPTRNASKDYATMQAAADLCAHRHATVGKKILFLVVGETASPPALPAPHTETRFLPFAADPRSMAECYAAADVYLQGSIADTFPNTVLEAMACALPIVATRVGGIPEQVIHGQTGLLVTSADAEAMAAALAIVLSDVAVARSMGERGAAHVRTHFDLERQVSAMLDYYQEILASSRR